MMGKQDLSNAVTWLGTRELWLPRVVHDALNDSACAEINVQPYAIYVCNQGGEIFHFLS